MDIVKANEFFRDLDKEQFDQSFTSLVKGDIFSAVASGVGTDTELHAIGDQIQMAGLTDLDPNDRRAVMDAVHMIITRIYQEHYHP